MKTPEESVKEITQCFTGNGDYFFEYVTPEDCLGVLKKALRQHDVSLDICCCEARTFYVWEKEENTCSQCGRPITQKI